jgi:hypothetical protein
MSIFKLFTLSLKSASAVPNSNQSPANTTKQTISILTSTTKKKEGELKELRKKQEATEITGTKSK